MQAASNVEVDCGFPGGNIILEGIDGDTVRLSPDLRDTEGWWFYWYFCVRGAEGRTLRFIFQDSDPIGVRGPAVSTDRGQTWRWLGRDDTCEPVFSYSFPAMPAEVRFSFGMPYLQHNLERFLQHYERSPHLKRAVLCKTRKGRDVEMLRLGHVDGNSAHRVFLTCRHHACEMMANYALEGVMAEVLQDSRMWDNVDLAVVPFVDKDGVEDGDQGKNRKPHDHNRDYAGDSVYPSVAAIREYVPVWSQGRLRLTLDLHCPHIRGAYNEAVYFPGPRDAGQAERLQRFSRILEATSTSPIPYSAKDNLPYGQAWNTDKGRGVGKSCSKWFSELPENPLAATLEIPYANANGVEVNADSAREFGRGLARAIHAFLMKECSPKTPSSHGNGLKVAPVCDGPRTSLEEEGDE